MITDKTVADLVTIQLGGSDEIYATYASEDEAYRYLAVDPTRSAAWEAMEREQRRISLIAASRRIDHFDWSGEKAVSTQELDWPRKNYTCDGGIITGGMTGLIPMQIIQAAILLAGSIAIDPSNFRVVSGDSNIEMVKAGSATVKFFHPRSIRTEQLQDRHAFELIQCFLKITPPTSSFGIASGTCDRSTFTEHTDSTKTFYY